MLSRRKWQLIASVCIALFLIVSCQKFGVPDTETTVTSTEDRLQITNTDSDLDDWLPVLISEYLSEPSSGTGSPTAPPPNPEIPVINSFTATELRIVPGQSTNLNWSISGGGLVLLSIDQGIGEVTGTSIAVSPTVTTTYTLTASNVYFGSVQESITVNVLSGFSSNLPIVSITTNNTIVDEPKVDATMSIYSGENRNFLVDDSDDYIIGIEIRGRTSQTFPKKQYGIETRDATGENDNVELLGMPKENDWILYAPYTDKSLMRNALAYNLARRMGRYASRVEFIEVFINQEYQGIYVLMEKVKRDKNRVDVKKQKSDDLTGGYILEIGWPTQVPTNGDAFIDLPGTSHPVLYEYPDADEVSSEAHTYISDYVLDFHNTLYSSSFKDPTIGYRKYIDVDSAVDYMIVQELFKNVDAYLASAYFHKNLDSINEELVFGPVWDFNISSGNDSTSAQRNTPTGWMLHDTMGRTHTWAGRLLEDPYFVNEYYIRWQELKAAGILQELRNDIASYSNLLDEAQQRNFTKWPILDELVIYNPPGYVFDNYSEVVDDLDDWFEARIQWMDQNITINLQR